MSPTGMSPPRGTTFGVVDAGFVAAAAIAIAAALMGFYDLHRLAKPLATALVIALAWRRGVAARDPVFARLLVAGLALSLAGDVALMFEGYFIAGLVAFLGAHLCYLAMFKRGVPWLPNRTAAVATLAAAAALYAVLFAGLDAVLRVAVALYAAVIALMTAQAIGRAGVLGAGAGAALGAMVFMVSDALLAIDRFTHPLPLASLWVLSTYWTAQWLIARFAAPGAAGL